MDEIFSHLAKTFLSFSHPTLIIPLIIIGYIAQTKAILRSYHSALDVWQSACLFIFFTMIFNTLLKSLFLVPLNPALGKEGFAFPSGHMQVAVVFYGWLFLVYTKPLIRNLILVILGGIAFGLIQQGYHNFSDVIASVVFGMITIYGFTRVSQLPTIQNKPAHLGSYLILLSAVMMGIIHYRIEIPIHVYAGFLGLLGMTGVGYFCMEEKTS